MQKLTKPEYFGQYGKILKIVVNKDKPFNPRGSNGPTYSAYVTYSSDKEASLAILVPTSNPGRGQLRVEEVPH